ncbi:T9SS type A sorting domain-containing protein [Bacteroidota bacterium]
MADDPVTDGFQITVNANFDKPIGFSSLELYSPSGLTDLTSSSATSTLDIQNYTIFGGVISSKAIDNFGVGTNQLIELRQDYELRFTGIYDEGTIINEQTVHQVISGGQWATVFRMASGSYLAEHPLNPNPGVAEPFLIRIPFEVWNVEDPENQFQVNLSFRDRVRFGDEDPFWSWNPTNRMYSIIVNSPYDSTQVIQVDDGPDEFNAPATWVTVHYGTNYHPGDVVRIFYKGPVQFGIDEYTFTTPAPVDTTTRVKPITDYKLFQNYPNPFNPETTIRFQIPEPGIVILEVYDILGQRVARLLNQELNSDSYEVVFNGSHLASGVYFYTVNIKDKFFDAKKMVLLK